MSENIDKKLPFIRFLKENKEVVILRIKYFKL